MSSNTWFFTSIVSHMVQVFTIAYLNTSSALAIILYNAVITTYIIYSELCEIPSFVCRVFQQEYVWFYMLPQYWDTENFFLLEYLKTVVVSFLPIQREFYGRNLLFIGQWHEIVDIWIFCEEYSKNSVHILETLQFFPNFHFKFNHEFYFASKGNNGLAVAFPSCCSKKWPTITKENFITVSHNFGYSKIRRMGKKKSGTNIKRNQNTFILLTYKLIWAFFHKKLFSTFGTSSNSFSNQLSNYM